jgi:hypothetical protein
MYFRQTLIMVLVITGLLAAVVISHLRIYPQLPVSKAPIQTNCQERIRKGLVRRIDSIGGGEFLLMVEVDGHPSPVVADGLTRRDVGEEIYFKECVR